MKVLFAASEAIPYAKTGGLADVAGTLVTELRKAKTPALLFLPLYKEIEEKFRPEDMGVKVNVNLNGESLSGSLHSHGPAVFIACDRFFGRPELYGTAEGDFPDNSKRFAFFSRAVLEAARALDFRPDIVHVHDWQVALVPLYLKTLYKRDLFYSGTKSVLTIHNMGYQGIFPKEELPYTGLPKDLFNPEGIEYFGRVNFLKGGLISADVITTVSPTYAREIMTPEQGFGLDGVLRKRADSVKGILNGIDYAAWDPASDGSIPARYSRADISGKARCKAALADRFGFKDRKAPVVAFIGRLSSQKGVDLFLPVAGEVAGWGANIAVLGKGDEYFQREMTKLSGGLKGRVHAEVSFDEPLARLIYAGADMFLMPSRYEPCGLGQLISMRYGTPAVARQTGGLADTIEDFSPFKCRGTGFLFKGQFPDDLRQCLRAALCTWLDRKRWDVLVKSAMKRDFSWKRPVREYLKLYSELAGRTDEHKT